ncbi:MAG: Holliday junction branch migration protein RuvA [Terriglobales bacterium]
MIARLSGTLIERQPGRVVIETHGVGYELQIPVSTFEHLPAAGAAVTLLVHTHVREDALQLFGFATAAEKQLFEKLISVSGIGPRLAVALLGGLAADALASAIRQGDLPRLTSIPGVGKKTAERLILELRDKMPQELAAAPGSALSGTAEDVLSALVNLGYPHAAAAKAVQRAAQTHPGVAFDQLFAQCMKAM